MKVVYIASPYRGNVEENVKFARECCRKVVEEGNVPIAPHLLFPQFMSDDTERDKAIAMNKELIARCDELWACGWEISPGMKAEIEEAFRLHKPIFRRM